MYDNTLLNKLTLAGVKEEMFSDAQVLCLPENILHASEGEELLEPADLVTFSKILKAEGVRVFTLLDAGIDLATLERRSGDKWLGTVWIRDAALPLTIGVLANIIYGLAAKTSNSSEQHLATPVIHVELVIGSGANQTNIKYDGDAGTLGRVLESIRDERQTSTSTKNVKRPIHAASTRNRKKHK